MSSDLQNLKVIHRDNRALGGREGR
jgi:hypothetical protein